jgi:tetratricopeptide (TPR) repeat protein
MSDVSTKPVIFISYARADEPETPADGEMRWLTFVMRFLQPAAKGGVFEMWADRQIAGGAAWSPEIEEKLRTCDIFVLLVSTHSMASDYVVDKEIATIRARQEKGEPVHFYPLLLTPTPEAGLAKVNDKNLRPSYEKPFSAYSAHDRARHMKKAADEIAKIAEGIAKRKRAALLTSPAGSTRGPIAVGIAGASPAMTAWQDIAPSGPPPEHIHVTRLPETGYERLVGRDAELNRLDDAWADRNTNILSLVAEGGAGKSALVNEWLTRLQADNYRGAAAVLGWSFYSQGTKERATAADAFLNWALDKLDVTLDTTSAIAKGEAIAEALAQRRVLLVLDGVEPLQHGLGAQQGELKDLGLRALLRRFAAMAPAGAHRLVVLTSRLAVKDITRWKDSSAPVLDVEELSDEAGAELLRDNGVWGTDTELQAAARAFGGHPLAVGLLASFLKETQFGDVRRRDHIREFFADPENPRHDHAKRVMESYEKEWLSDDPAPSIVGFLARVFGKPRFSVKARMRAIMHLVGLFDRPASGDCLAALRRKPAIQGLTDALVDLDETEWRRAIAHLRDVRLLAPDDREAPETLDAHPLVREWFGQRLERAHLKAWRAGHSRLYEHLRDTTREGEMPTLESLASLYQAIPHGCRAGRHQETLSGVYINRICRRLTNGQIEFYSLNVLGAVGSDLAAVSWFFDKPYEAPIAALKDVLQSWVLSQGAFALRSQGRFAEALPAMRAALQICRAAKDWSNAATCAANLSNAELLVGEIAAALATAEQSVAHADYSHDEFWMIVSRAVHASALHAAGRYDESERLFADAERRQNKRPEHPLLYSMQGYQYCDLLLSRNRWATVYDRANRTIEFVKRKKWLVTIALDTLTVSRAHLGMMLANVTPWASAAAGRDDARANQVRLGEAVDGLRASGQLDDVARGLLARTAFRRSVGDWDGAARDLDEVEEIAEPGPMRLYLCDMALERARLAFARIEAFAPLNGLIDNGPPPPVPPSADEAVPLAQEARDNLATAGELITGCGYHKRDEELAELEAVRDGRRRLADLPPRV